ncbi:TIGR03560 family F420-dependent LLM class oxidoreductase [Pseudonocardia sp. TRM90224]|uniref:TIGR03560 family F420-dependent LLM class oxidoreductase n=1 Tax=Pseudonocardia sp. TRM90224 TaxID=2812678 RepID=UPI001E5BD39C|nr:TIGR03560 family F420-dependent LLM class oxidoreductase [Pseudonocardia sp. TRM90224]
MRISLSLTEYTFPGGAAQLAQEMGRIAKLADDGGLDTLWVPDHMIQGAPGTNVTDAMLEPYTALGYLAAVTRRIRLGAAVSAVTFRPPSLLIKAVTTLDVLSGGRAWLGIGAGYLQEEADMMGLPLPPTGERFEHLEDTLRLALQMWAGDESAFEGTHHRLTRPVNSPPALSGPHPPIMIGGTGEKKTLRLVARFGQACNLPDIPDGGLTIRRKLDVLAGHCADVGRPFSEVEKTVATRINPDESAAAFAERCAALAELGIEHAMVITSGPFTPERVERLAEAAALVRDVEAVAV